jgi:hypothetical protein
MEDLKGKMMYGFEFSGGPGYTHMMKNLVGKLAVIKSQRDTVCQVMFSDGAYWNYPYPEILDHLVEKEDDRTIDEIIIELKQLTSKL